MSTRRRLAPLVAASVAIASVVAALPAPTDASSVPTVVLRHPGTRVTVERWTGEPVTLPFGSHVATVGGAFELHAGSDGSVRQMARDAQGTPHEVRRFERGANDLSDGLNAFFVVTVRDGTGTVVGRRRLPFCPSSGDVARLDDSGPATPTMPGACHASAITRSTVFGIDRGWAVAAPPDGTTELALDDGDYVVTLSIATRWVRALQVPSSGTSVTFPLSVRTVDDTDGRRFGDQRAGTGDQRAGAGAGTGGVPDLVALPAWQVTVEHDRDAGHDLLMFAASVWNAGTGPLVVEGFRPEGSDSMTAYQYFYDGDEVVGRSRAGTLDYHTATGHEHWHFTDFARYSLLDRTTGAVVRSGKESFCLTWTDPVDLTLPDAAWNPGTTSLATACGRPESIWIREALPVGWGDTYHQSLPGQSFDVTSVPNGRYAIEVAANPDGRLTDGDASNDVAVREIVLGGGRGQRTVEAVGAGPDGEGRRATRRAGR